jgi:hypothetical protein
MATTFKASIDCEKTISRLSEHLRGAAEQLDKFKTLRAPEVERGSREPYPQPEDGLLQRESIDRRRTKSALISELKEAVEAAHNLPPDPMY